MSSQFETLFHRLKSGVSTVELAYVPHDQWPLPRRPSANVTTSGPLRISVLDSSFNPPTLAHFALASTHAPTCLNHDILGSADFDARLLLLSVRNADKSVKPHDATYAQRLEMMILLAKDLMAEKDSHTPNGESNLAQPGQSNVAVAIIDEPTFVGKSQVLLEFLQERLASTSVDENRRVEGNDQSGASTTPTPRLTFLVGIDTLERILLARYYASEEDMRQSLRHFLSSDGDDSYILCARRVTQGLIEPEDTRERKVLSAVAKYLDFDRVVMVDIGAEVKTLSSSEVRERIGLQDALWKEMVTESVARYITRQNLYALHDGI